MSGSWRNLVSKCPTTLFYLVHFSGSCIRGVGERFVGRAQQVWFFPSLLSKVTQVALPDYNFMIPHYMSRINQDIVNIVKRETCLPFGFSGRVSASLALFLVVVAQTGTPVVPECGNDLWV